MHQDDDCSLLDLGFSGPNFTWCNRRFKGNLVYARLDCGLYNLEWLELFPHFKLSYNPFGFSDHMALVAKLQATLGNIFAKNINFFCSKHFGHVIQIVKTSSGLAEIQCNGLLLCIG